MGQYLLTSHTGDLEISIPASAAADIRARSKKGQSHPDLSGGRCPSSVTQGSLLLRGGTNSASSFVLRSFKCNIHVKRRKLREPGGAECSFRPASDVLHYAGHPNAGGNPHPNENIPIVSSCSFII
jgi:hypothetical protein